MSDQNCHPDVPGNVFNFIKMTGFQGDDAGS